MLNSNHLKPLEQHFHRFLWRDLKTDRDRDVYIMTRVNVGDIPAPAISMHWSCIQDRRSAWMWQSPRGDYRFPLVKDSFPGQDGKVRRSRVTVRYKSYCTGKRVHEYRGATDTVVPNSVQRIAILVEVNWFFTANCIVATLHPPGVLRNYFLILAAKIEFFHSCLELAGQDLRACSTFRSQVSSRTKLNMCFCKMAPPSGFDTLLPLYFLFYQRSSDCARCAVGDKLQPTYNVTELRQVWMLSALVSF